VPHRHDAGQKPKRQKQRLATAKTGAKPRAGVDFVAHPVFGEIPLIESSVALPDGRVHTFKDFDPDYAPPLPKGALRGDVRKQEFCRMCHRPRYYYVDEARSCAECGGEFTFKAAEQKHWYESLKFHFDSVPVRCLACRRKRRSERSLQQELGDAKALLKQTPDSVAALLGVARAIVRFRERTAQGSIVEALAAARRARRLLKGHPASELAEADFWEASSHALAGRAGTARPFFQRFVEHARGRDHAALVTEAKRWLTLNSAVDQAT
jgi:hypothetical protein